jgi:hypothetical protein
MRWPVSLSTHVFGGTSPVADGFDVSRIGAAAGAAAGGAAVCCAPIACGCAANAAVPALTSNSNAATAHKIRSGRTVVLSKIERRLGLIRISS